MGRPDDFVRGSSDLVRGIAHSPLLEGRTGESLVDETAGVAAGTILVGGTCVGRGSDIGSGCRLDDTVVFDGVTIEPGSYLPGEGGVRIEDMVLLTAEGAESLTRCSRELIII